MNCFIGIDGGGTKTIGLLADPMGKIYARAEFGPSNYHAVGEAKTKKGSGGSNFSVAGSSECEASGLHRLLPRHGRAWPPGGSGSNRANL